MGTKYAGTEPEVRALNAYIALMRCAETVTNRTHHHILEKGLTFGQFAALEALVHCGPLRQNQLAAKVLRSAGNMTKVLDNLEKRGLTKRQRETQDRRCLLITVTPKGRRLIESIMPAHVRGLTGVLSVLTPAEQQELARLCSVLGRSACEEGAAPCAGACEQ